MSQSSVMTILAPGLHNSTIIFIFKDFAKKILGISVNFYYIKKVLNDF